VLFLENSDRLVTAGLGMVSVGMGSVGEQVTRKPNSDSDNLGM